jgi:outer membrane protein OmpA-like peptidoglycan-associated protein
MPQPTRLLPVLLRLLPLLTGLLAALHPAPAHADQISYALELKKRVGEGDPSVTVTVHEPIAGFELRLRRSDGEAVVRRGKGPPGSVHTLRLPQPEGRFAYEGELSVTDTAGETASVHLSFSAEVLGPLQLTVREEDLDLAGHKLRFRLSRPAAKAHLVVQMDTGRTAFDGEVPFSGQTAGTPLEVSWPAAEGRVLRITLKVFDAADAYAGVELFPWRLDIPHEEVNFDLGRADIRPLEHGKLQASFERITTELRRVSPWAGEVRLYVLGHTDTVGSAADNRALSLRRARAIAAHLRKLGLRIPIYVEGFGEEALRVPTADETPEEGNRRTEYILAKEHPRLPGAPVLPNWRKL